MFRLREGILWQDLPPVNGRALTAGDVAFSYERQKTEGWPNSPLLLAMDTAEAVDDSVLRVTLRFSDTDFLAALADGRSKVVAREAVDGGRFTGGRPGGGYRPLDMAANGGRRRICT